MREDSTANLGPQELAAFLRIGEDQALPRDPALVAELTADALAEHLSCPFPFGQTRAGPAQSQQPVLGTDAQQHRPVRAVLLGTGSVNECKQIQEWGKNLAAREATEPSHTVECDAATAIYYAAIASSLVHHGERASSKAYAELASTFKILSSKRWMDTGLAGLFSEARRAIKARMP